MNPPPVDYLLQLANGYAATGVLATALELDLFATLDKLGPTELDDLAIAIGLSPRPAEQFLAACVGLGLTIVDADNRCHNSDLATAYLLPHRPGYLGDFVRFQFDREYPAWHRLADALRDNQPITRQSDPRRHRLFDRTDPDIKGFITALHPMAISAGAAMAKLPIWDDHHALLDVGGGSGGYSLGLCEALPALTATVYDVDDITDITRGFVGHHGRITVIDGDFYTDPALPGSHDTILLANILHDWGPDTRAMLLTKAHAALPHNGAIIIIEHMLDDTRTGPLQAAVMGLNMIVETDAGRSYHPADHAKALRAAGFTDIQTHASDLPTGNYLIIGRAHHLSP
ncbi:methyltransferase [Nocardia vulneris]|uniref:methyltransferase n=1 Tax=Nocardia vulneris TaxID=1141657 RepID=UPI0030D5EB6F